MKRLRPRTDLPEHIQSRLRELYEQIGLPQLWPRLQRVILTEHEVGLVEKTGAWEKSKPLVAADAMLDIVAEQRHWTLERAVLEIGLELGFLGAGDYKVLRRAIGEPVDAETEPPPKERSTPHWDREHGKLWFGGKEVRKVQIRKKPSRIETILNAFEKAKWQPISEPFGRRLSETRIHQIVNRLNTGLTKIRFHAHAGGQEIIWAVEPK